MPGLTSRTYFICTLCLELEALFLFSGEPKSDDITALTALEVPPVHVL